MPQQEIKIVRADGGIIFAEITSGFLMFHNKKAVQVVVRDINQKKKYEEELSNLARLNLLGKMAASFAHEIRNPLTTIRGFLQLLKGKKEYIEHNKYFQLMIEEIDQVNSIITEFLSLGRNKMSEVDCQDLNEIIKAIFPLIQADALRSNIDVKLELGNISELLLNKKEIRQLLFNLTRNGIEAMETGGVLTIKTYEKDENIVLMVQDEGKGIEPEVLENIGKPFFSTKASGTGLGLSICYSIVAKHNAEIKVDTGSTGTTFYACFKKPKISF